MLLAMPSWASAPRQPDFAHAIAFAEGFYVKHSKGQRNHNPGNVQRHEHYAHFKNDAQGWAALYEQIDMVRRGESTRYTVDMTLAEFGRIYANGNRNWARNVATVLGVTTGTRIWEILDCPPRVPVKMRLEDFPI